MAISVVLPIYQGKKFIKEQLQSILKQTHPPEELIIVDDGCTDGTLEICQKILENFPVLFMQTSNLGPNQAFLRGIKAAKCPWIALSDQDDIWDPDKLKVLSSYCKTGVDLLVSDSRLINADGSAIVDKKGKQRLMSELIVADWNEHRQNPELFFFLNCISSHALILRKASLEKKLCFWLESTPGWILDQSLGCFFFHANSVHILPQALLSHRLHIDSCHHSHLISWRKKIGFSLKRTSKIFQSREYAHRFYQTFPQYSCKGKYVLYIVQKYPKLWPLFFLFMRLPLFRKLVRIFF